MKMKYLITAATAIVLCVVGAQEVQAQKVYKEGSVIVMDFGPGTGFPQGAVETTKGQKVITPSQTVLGTNNDENGTINKTVYKKLEIAVADEATGLVWNLAYAKCTN